MFAALEKYNSFLKIKNILASLTVSYPFTTGLINFCGTVTGVILAGYSAYKFSRVKLK
jgi:ABC-type iron transport system FetAB permease component